MAGSGNFKGSKIGSKKISPQMFEKPSKMAMEGKMSAKGKMGKKK